MPSSGGAHLVSDGIADTFNNLALMYYWQGDYR